MAQFQGAFSCHALSDCTEAPLSPLCSLHFDGYSNDALVPSFNVFQSFVPMLGFIRSAEHSRAPYEPHRGDRVDRFSLNVLGIQYHTRPTFFLAS